MFSNYENGVLTLYLDGSIDSMNANSVEYSINEAISSKDPVSIVFDLKTLNYISSAGLRVMLKLKKRFKSLKLINASSEVYEIFDTTGFVEIMDITKAMREIDIEGCQLIGEGANGKVYRIARDTIVKTYKNASIEDIRRERELSRTAFILGIPTAIPYDVVKVGDSYGSVFELLNAKSFDEIMKDSEDNIEFVAGHIAQIAKIIHSTPAPDTLPDTDDDIYEWIEQVKEYFTEEETEKFKSLIAALPKDSTMIHGDLHIKNLMQQNDETLLIDMDTLAKGHPIYELAFMYNAYKGFGIADHGVVERFFGISCDTAGKLFKRILELYLETDDESRLNEVEEKASLIGLLRVMRRPINKGIADTEENKKLIAVCEKRIKELLKDIDSLEF